MPCSSWGRNGIPLYSLSPRQEEGHSCGQGRFTAQLFFEVESDCFLGLSSARKRALLCHTLLLDSLVLACSFKSQIWRQSHPIERPDLGELGGDKEDCLWPPGKGLWGHLGPHLPHDQEHHSHDSDCPVSLPSAILWPPLLVVLQRWVNLWSWAAHEHLLLLECLLKLGAPCRPALAICLLKSCHNSLIQSSCWWGESTLGAKVHSPW